MSTLYLKASRDTSKKITALYSTSFSLATRLLGAKIRESIFSIYGFVRLADEIVDSFTDQDQQQLMDEFTQDLDNALLRKFSLNPVLHAFQNVVHTYQIDRSLIDAFMASMQRDLSPVDFVSQEEYTEYIFGSADAVGLMCLQIFVKGDKSKFEALKPSAQRLGSAYQKVNFLRDIKDDKERLGRSYFPSLSLGKNLNTQEMQSIIEDIEKDFQAAFIGIKQLPLDSQLGVYTSYRYYTSLLKKIKQQKPEKLFTERIRISNTLKLILLGKSYLRYKTQMLKV